MKRWWPEVIQEKQGLISVSFCSYLGEHRRRQISVRLMENIRESLLMFPLQMYSTFPSVPSCLSTCNNALLASQSLNFETTQKQNATKKKSSLKLLPLIHTLFLVDLSVYWQLHWLPTRLTIDEIIDLLSSSQFLFKTYQFFMCQYLHKKSMPWYDACSWKWRQEKDRFLLTVGVSRIFCFCFSFLLDLLFHVGTGNFSEQ